MAISRPFLLAVLGLALLAATFVSVQNARNSASSDAAPSAQAPPPAEAPQAQTEPAVNPVDTLKSSVSGKLESAAFDVRLKVSGDRRDSATVALTGAFERGAANDIPAVVLNADVDFEGNTFKGGFVAAEENAYFTQRGDAWQVPQEAWDPVVQAVADGSATPAASPPIQLHPENWVRDAKSEAGEKLDGVETTHLSAQVDTQAAARELLALAPAGAGVEIPRQVARAEIDAWVGSDGILRRFTARLGPPRSTIDFALNLTGVNEAQNIEPPANVRAGLPGGAYGQFVRGFSGGLSGVTGTEPLSLAALATDNPKKAARAVRAHKKVVIFFRNPRGLDDRAVARSVRSVDRRSKAVVLTDHMDAVERYGKLVEDLAVSQTPSIVLVDRAGDARLIEGFIDSNSLTQAVADAR